MIYLPWYLLYIKSPRVRRTPEDKLAIFTCILLYHRQHFCQQLYAPKVPFFIICKNLLFIFKLYQNPMYFSSKIILILNHASTICVFQKIYCPKNSNYITDSCNNIIFMTVCHQWFYNSIFS